MEISGQIKKVSISFIIISMLAVISSMYMFYYASDNYSKIEGKILGTKTENNDNSLFGNKVWLARTADNSTVYAIIGSQKHLIRNEEVFNSYDFSFRNVRVITKADLDKYQLVRLVKEQGTGRTYYLSYEKNLKKYHHSPQAFAAYRSNSWNNVIEVSSRDLSFWPDATLLKAEGDPKVYFITKDNKRAWIPSESEFDNADFQWNNVTTVNNADLGTYIEVTYNINLVRERSAAADNTGQPASTTPPASLPASAAQLIASLDSSSPSASLFPFSTADNLVSAFKLQAAGSRIDVKSIKITKQGILNQSYITSIALEDANGVELGRANGMNNNSAVVDFSGSPLMIARNSYKVLRVKVGFAQGTNINHTANFGIQSEGDIKTSSPAAVSGIFPLFGQTHKLVISSGLVGQVEIASGAINNTIRNINIGSKNEAVAKFNIAETSGNEDAKLNKIIFTNWGSAQEDSINNIILYNDRKAVMTVKDMQNSKITFNLSDKNLSFSKKDPLELELKVDVVGGQNLTLKVVVEKPGDVEIKGLSQGYNLVVSSSENFPVGNGGSDDYNKVSFKHGGLGFFASRMEEKNQEIYRAKADSLIGQFELRNTNQDIFLQRMRIKIEKHKGAPDFEVNLTLRDETNKKAIVSIPKERIAGGVIADFSLDNYKIAADKAVIIKVLGDVPESAETNNAYQIIIPEFSYKIGLDNTEYRQTEETVGQLMRVYAPRATLTSAALSNGGTAAAGKVRIELGSFSVSASSDEQIKITGITAALNTGSADVNYVGGFSNLSLYSGARRVSNIIAQPNSRSYIFSNLNIQIAAGASLPITINADTEDIAGERNVQFMVETVSAEGYSSHAPVIIEGEGAISNAVSITKPAK